MRYNSIKLVLFLLFISWLSSCGPALEQPGNTIYLEAKDEEQSFITEPLPLEQCFRQEDEGFLSKNLKNLLPAMVAIPTVRTDDLSSEQEIEQIEKVKGLLDTEVENFNEGNKNKLRPFEWKKEVDGKPFWVFGYRLGTGKKKIALITHVDVVPATEKAFELKCENREYQGVKQPFFVGRGALDDKGPTITALSTIEALAHNLPANSLKNITIELIIDTSEEVQLGAHYYFNDPESKRPDFGIVVDAAWCTVAEKGIERPVFTFYRGKMLKDGLWIRSITVPKDNPPNVIPDYAQAVINGKNLADIDDLKNTIEERYKAYAFDDPHYRKAKLSVSKNKKGMLVLRTEVSGAQHGSAPQENRAEGANPLVSLLNFLAHLTQTNILQQNAYSNMALFVKEMFGTMVFGEKHPDLLQRSDSIFKSAENNGTTYAITKVSSIEDSVQLFLDIRYALDHQQDGWDGKTYGTLKGKSIFNEAFKQLVKNFKKKTSIRMSFETETAAAPDLKDPTSEVYTKVNKAFKNVMNMKCPQKAIGGATDAKGEAFLISAGTLFDLKFGYPTYFHGKSEGVPVDDLYKTSEILLELLNNELNKGISHSR